jgi:hypothetical protein
MEKPTIGLDGVLEFDHIQIFTEDGILFFQ